MNRRHEPPRHSMTAIVFGTLAYAEKLEASGFTPEQAKGQAHALREIIDNQIATKQDTAVLEANLTTKLAVRAYDDERRRNDEAAAAYQAQHNRHDHHR